MKKVLLLLVSITLVFAVNACKNDVKQSDAAETVAEETTFPKESRELTQEELQKRYQDFCALTHFENYEL